MTDIPQSGMPRPDLAAPLQSAVSPSSDSPALDRLLDLAGPETGRDLLDRLVSDLGVVQDGLTRAGPRLDWPAIRNHSHVLISLAGALGSQRLQAGAETLNLIAHRMDSVAVGDLLAAVQTDLEKLIAVVRQIRATYLVRHG